MQRAGACSIPLPLLAAALLLALPGCEDKPSAQTAPSASPSAMIAPRELPVVPAALPKPPELGTLPLPPMSATDMPKPPTSAAPAAGTTEAPKTVEQPAAGKTGEPPAGLRRDPKSPGPGAPRGAATE